MNKARRDAIEATLPADRRFKMPPQMTDEMRHAAYRSYCESYKEKGYIAWDDICKCFMSAFAVEH